MCDLKRHLVKLSKFLTYVEKLSDILCKNDLSKLFVLQLWQRCWFFFCKLQLFIFLRTCCLAGLQVHGSVMRKFHFSCAPIALHKFLELINLIVYSFNNVGLLSVKCHFEKFYTRLLSNIWNLQITEMNLRCPIKSDKCILLRIQSFSSVCVECFS